MFKFENHCYRRNAQSNSQVSRYCYMNSKGNILPTFTIQFDTLSPFQKTENNSLLATQYCHIYKLPRKSVSKQQFIIKREFMLILLTFGKLFSLSGYLKQICYANKSAACFRGYLFEFSKPVLKPLIHEILLLHEFQACALHSLQHCFNR